jgi:hypothetical protein
VQLAFFVCHDAKADILTPQGPSPLSTHTAGRALQAPEGTSRWTATARIDGQLRSTPIAEPAVSPRVIMQSQHMKVDMGFGRGALLWLLGIPLPIILLLALFMHH